MISDQFLVIKKAIDSKTIQWLFTLYKNTRGIRW